jgi:hypothetical protein
LTKTLTTTDSQVAWEASINAACPACRAPIVATRPTLDGKAARAAASSARERTTSVILLGNLHAFDEVGTLLIGEPAGGARP